LDTESRLGRAVRPELVREDGDPRQQEEVQEAAKAKAAD